MNFMNKILILLISFIVLIVSTVCAYDLCITWDSTTANEDGTPVFERIGYRVYYGVSSGNYPDVIDAGTNIVLRIKGLFEGVTYYIAVTAYAEGRESFYSEELVWPNSEVNDDPTSPLRFRFNNSNSPNILLDFRK